MVISLKEWIYIAVLGLAAVIMSFTMLRDSSADCVAVAKYITTGKGNLIVTADDTASDSCYLVRRLI